MCSVKCANPGTAAGSEKWPARTSRAAAALAASLSWINRASSPLDSLTHLYVRGSRGGALISSRCSKTVAVVVGTAPPACCRSVAEAVTVLQRARGRFRKEAAWPGGESTEAVRSVVSAIWRQEMRIAPCAHRTKATRKRGWWSPLPAPPAVDGRPSTPVTEVSRARGPSEVLWVISAPSHVHISNFSQNCPSQTYQRNGVTVSVFTQPRTDMPTDGGMCSAMPNPHHRSFRLGTQPRVVIGRGSSLPGPPAGAARTDGVRRSGRSAGPTHAVLSLIHI